MLFEQCSDFCTPAPRNLLAMLQRNHIEELNAKKPQRFQTPSTGDTVSERGIGRRHQAEHLDLNHLHLSGWTVSNRFRVEGVISVSV